ncbi:MAG: flagellar hook-basal body complex protein [Lachnospiraceae bacterium]|nr:flagellar hook-basal body complex protein [Lachnospiraceae bacterium]
MLRAMDSAVSGLRAHQNKMDVIGNNIANVNTSGYKSQNYTFKDAMYQTTTASSNGQSGTVGGSNAVQYGYGSVTGAISTDMTSSTPSYVGGFNASINGSGFFITKSTGTGTNIDTKVTADNSAETISNNLKAANFNFTRVGQFSVDANGYMVDANGNFVYGFQPLGNNNSTTLTLDEIGNPGYKYGTTLTALRAPALTGSTTVEAEARLNFTGGATQLKSVQIDNDGTVKGTISFNGESKNVVIGKVAIANFQNQEGLMKAGNNNFNASANDNSGFMTATMPGGSTSSLMSGYLESSNVDLAKEFSDMIVTERGFQANSKMITVSDEILQELVNMKR